MSVGRYLTRRFNPTNERRAGIKCHVRYGMVNTKGSRLVLYSTNVTDELSS